MRAGSGHPLSVSGRAAQEKHVWSLHAPSDPASPLRWVGGSPQVLGGVAGCRRCHQQVLACALEHFIKVRVEKGI